MITTGGFLNPLFAERALFDFRATHKLFEGFLCLIYFLSHLIFSTSSSFMPVSAALQAVILFAFDTIVLLTVSFWVVNKSIIAVGCGAP